MSLAAGRPDPERAYALWLDALARAGWVAEPGTERLAVADALGRVTADPVVARWPSPRSDCSAMDGIATRTATLRSAVVSAAGAAADQDAAACVMADDGTADRDAAACVMADGAVRLPDGCFQWIDTGDPMPDTADTVVMREWLLPQPDGSVVITGVVVAGAVGTEVKTTARAAGSGAVTIGGSAVAPGKHVRRAGEDFAAGEVLVPAGRRLRPGDLAAAAAGGHQAVAVARPPTVAIIPTGDEIRSCGSPLRPGDIIDTSSLMLAARCRELGARPVLSEVQPDDPNVLAAEIRHAALTADLVLVIAGSSRGRDDHTGAVLAQVGGVAVTGVAVRPGHPALLGHVKHRAGVAPVIGLPGYPLATAVIFELFAAPLLAVAGGAGGTGGGIGAGGTAGSLGGPGWAGRTLLAALDQDWTSPPGLEEWILVTLAGARHAAGPARPPVATPARRGAGSISQLARADAWWRIRPDEAGFAAGTMIDVRPLTPG